MGRAERDTNNRVVAKYKRARHDYEIEDVYEAGISLAGSEVKSIRAGAVTLSDGYCADYAGELYLHNVHIAEYTNANQHNHEPTSRRKLLLHRREIDKIIEAIRSKGRTCVPLSMYLKSGRVKVELGVGRGKKQWDRRNDIKQRDAKREIDRAKKSARDDD